jgi:hypothetical protein
MHPPDTHLVRTFADSTPLGSPVEELTSYAKGDQQFLRLGGGACFGGRNAEPPTRPPPPSRTPGCTRGSPGGGRRGVLATPSYTLVYEKVVAAELVVRRFSPQNTPLPPAVKTAGPPWRKKLVLPRGNPVGWGLQKCAPSACRAGAREAMHLVCTRAQNASRCRQGAWLHVHPPDTHSVRTFADPTPPGSPVEELTSYARGNRVFLRLGGGACFGGRNAEPPTRPPPPSRTPGCTRGSPGGLWGDPGGPLYQGEPGDPLVHPGVREGGGGRVGGSTFSPPKHAPPAFRKNVESPWGEELFNSPGEPGGVGYTKVLTKCVPTKCMRSHALCGHHVTRTSVCERPMVSPSYTLPLVRFFVVFVN